MLIASGLPRIFWAEALNASCYSINRCMIRPILNKTSYELFQGTKPNIMHLRIFGCKCYVHNNGKDALGKFDPRSDEPIFLGYSSHSKAYKVFNKRTSCVEESVHVLFDEFNSLVVNNIQEEDFELGLPKKDLFPFMKKVRIFKRDQGLDLFLRKESKVTNKQGEQLLNPIWNRTRRINQKQAPKHSCKQVLVQARKQGSE